jgi:putative nucleotidyltransferase with HDIG domain
MELAQPGGPIDTGSLWRHSVIAAVAAGTIARRLNLNEAEAFTAGLLHDVGKLIFMSAEPMIYESIVSKVGIHGPVLLEMERSYLGVTHAMVGARLLARWGLPANVETAVLYHHSSAQAPVQFGQLAAAISVANAVSHQVAADSQEGRVAPILAPATQESMKALGLTPEHLPNIIRQMERGLQRVQSLMDMVQPKASHQHRFQGMVA